MKNTNKIAADVFDNLVKKVIKDLSKNVQVWDDNARVIASFDSVKEARQFVLTPEGKKADLISIGSHAQGYVNLTSDGKFYDCEIGGKHYSWGSK